MLNKKDVYELKQNVVQEIGKNWVLISAKNPEGKVNTMTASWGGLGVLWGKNVVYIFIRESRYTKELIDKNEFFSLSFLDSSHKEALSFCGSHSGRNTDK